MTKYSKDPRVWGASIIGILIVFGAMGVNFKFASAESLEAVKLELATQKSQAAAHKIEFKTIQSVINQIRINQGVNKAINNGKFENIDNEFRRSEVRDRRAEATQQRIIDLLTKQIRLKTNGG